MKHYFFAYVVQYMDPPMGSVFGSRTISQLTTINNSDRFYEAVQFLTQILKGETGKEVQVIPLNMIYLGEEG